MVAVSKFSDGLAKPNGIDVFFIEISCKSVYKKECYKY
jgi:hypothetical protein